MTIFRNLFIALVFILSCPVAAGAQTLTFEKRYDYRNKASGKALLGSGWGEPEAFGIWTVGGSAEINIPLRQDTREVMVLFDTTAYITPRRTSQTITVKAESIVANWRYDRNLFEARREIRLGGLRGTDLKIAFSIRDPQSPKELGVDQDARQIGLGLREIVVKQYR